MVVPPLLQHQLRCSTGRVAARAVLQHYLHCSTCCVTALTVMQHQLRSAALNHLRCSTTCETAPPVLQNHLRCSTVHSSPCNATPVLCYQVPHCKAAFNARLPQIFQISLIYANGILSTIKCFLRDTLFIRLNIVAFVNSVYYFSK